MCKRYYELVLHSMQPFTTIQFKPKAIESLHFPMVWQMRWTKNAEHAKRICAVVGMKKKCVRDETMVVVWYERKQSPFNRKSANRELERDIFAFFCFAFFLLFAGRASKVSIVRIPHNNVCYIRHRNIMQSSDLCIFLFILYQHSKPHYWEAAHC